jgi:hypothetical protein
MTVPFFRGKDARFRFFFDGTERVLRAKTWDVSRNASKHADGVNGEDRDRLDSVTNYFEASVTAFQEDVAAWRWLLSDIENKDAQTLPLDKGAAITIKIIDGSKAAFVLDEVEVDDWKIAQGGRAEAVMLTIPLRARYFKEAPSL